MRPQAINLLCASLIFLYFSSYRPFFLCFIFAVEFVLFLFVTMYYCYDTFVSMCFFVLSNMVLLDCFFVLFYELNTFGGSLELIGVAM